MPQVRVAHLGLSKSNEPQRKRCICHRRVGRFTAHRVTAYNEQPRAFPLSANLRGGPVILAIRMFILPFTTLRSNQATA